MFKVLEGATAPTRATKYSAMVDLYSNANVVIGAGETKIVPLGVKIDLEDLLFKAVPMKNVPALWIKEEKERFMATHYLELHPRSSLRAKGLIIGVGVVDLDYDLEIWLIVHNPLRTGQIHTGYGELKLGIDIYKNFEIKKGDKIAQCTLVEHKGWLMGIESETERTGGFGSSDNGGYK